ncbi:MAG: phospholipase D-like domain-containing protein [Blastocatellia bacterium]
MIDQMSELQKDNQELDSRENFLAERVFNRATGAPLVTGNSVRILKDAIENYPAWLDAIRSAEKTIYFESYILYDDEYGEQFGEALKAKAREGVTVRLIYDWFGAVRKTSRRFWRRLMDEGVQVRAFNPPFFDSPFGWLSRDHRKMLAVDGRVGFVSGLCVGSMWAGDAEHGVEPWRDTGVEVRGPAVAEIEAAFAQMWSALGSPVPANELRPRHLIAAVGNVALRVVASAPNSAWLYRLDQLIAAGARETLWLTDAYFAGTTPYVQALRTAAMDNVDVRLLVPRATDIPVVRAISRAGYRPLLEAGVRVYEWNGTMLHAKTAVADGRWARVGSTNLNLSSWIGNWELDVVVEDKRFAEEMEELYLQDLENATEVVLNEKRRVRRVAEIERRHHRHLRDLGKSLAEGSSGRVAAGALSIGSAVKAAIANRRLLGPAEARSMGGVACLMLLLFVAALMWPRVIALPVAAFCLWLAISLAIRAFKLHRQGKREIDEADKTAASRHLQHP